LPDPVFHWQKGFIYMSPALLRASLLAACAVALAPLLQARAETVGPVTDAMGVWTIPKGAPIQIAGYWVISGADAALGVDEERGVQIAFKDHGDQIAGHPVKLSVEDDGCNAEGGQTAATKIAANPNVVLAIGPACSSSATAAAPILWKQGITDIGTATTAPKLTAPDRKPEYDGYVRTVYSDIDQGRADADYVFNQMKARKVVTVHDGSPFAQQLAAVMAENFKKLGGEVLSVEAIAPTDVDMHPLLTRIATEKPDIVYLPIFVAATAQIIRQKSEVSGLDKTIFLGSSGVMAPDLISAAGPSVVGFRITYPDVSPEALGKGYPAFVAKYKEAFGEAPISGYNANAYDGGTMAIMAIEKVAVTAADGTTYIGKKALHDAIYATAFEGLSGPIACDPHGECAKFKPAVYEYTNADPATFDIGKNPKKIFP
jgi:branched-chain amino acid transport system substrate-binding protein